MGNPQSVNGSVPRGGDRGKTLPRLCTPSGIHLRQCFPLLSDPHSPTMVSMRLWVGVGGAWWRPGKARMKSGAELRVELSLVRDLSGASNQRHDWGALPSAGIGGQSKAEGREASRDLRNKS